MKGDRPKLEQIPVGTVQLPYIVPLTVQQTVTSQLQDVSSRSLGQDSVLEHNWIETPLKTINKL